MLFWCRVQGLRTKRYCFLTPPCAVQEWCFRSRARARQRQVSALWRSAAGGWGCTRGVTRTASSRIYCELCMHSLLAIRKCRRTITSAASCTLPEVNPASVLWIMYTIRVRSKRSFSIVIAVCHAHPLPCFQEKGKLVQKCSKPYAARGCVLLAH